MESYIYSSSLFSLFTQLIIGLITFYFLSVPLKPKDKILGNILFIENIVQGIEFIFYIWLILNFFKYNNEVTAIRYIDWSITTPCMLFSIVCFMIYIENKEKDKTVTMDSIIQEHWVTLLLIFFANLFMLLFGFLGEISVLPKYFSISLGFVMFLGAFYLIFKEFLGNSLINKYLFASTFFLWALYGIAATLPYVTKNIFYNILDIFSKNVTALFLVLYIFFMI